DAFLAGVYTIVSSLRTVRLGHATGSQRAGGDMDDGRAGRRSVVPENPILVGVGAAVAGCRTAVAASCRNTSWDMVLPAWRDFDRVVAGIAGRSQAPAGVSGNVSNTEHSMSDSAISARRKKRVAMPVNAPGARPAKSGILWMRKCLPLPQPH